MPNIPSAIDQTVTPRDPKEMTPFEIDQFLTCARVGRIGIVLKGESYPYVVPVGYGYFEGRIFFHTCREGLKMKAVQSNPDVCFEVDESISDGSLAKSVIIFGRTEVIKEKDKMIPYLQKLIDKYRVPVSFNEYMAKGNRNIEDELENVRICLIAPKKITGKKMVRTNSNL